MGDRGPQAVGTLALMGTAAAGILGGIGGTQAVVQGDNHGQGLLIAAAWIFGVTLFGVVWYFLLWPALGHLGDFRGRLLPEPRPKRSPADPKTRWMWQRPAKSSSLQIIQALWGHDQGKWEDVTDFVRQLVGDGQSLNMSVGVSSIPVPDPAPGIVKTLKITYSTGRRKQTKSFTEAEGKAVLP